MKKVKQWQKKAKQTIKIIITFIKQTIKNYKSMKSKLKKIFALLIVILAVSSCGSTKVSVDKPASGTQTTITVTTNNPITTEVKPNLEMKGK